MLSLQYFPGLRSLALIHQVSTVNVVLNMPCDMDRGIKAALAIAY